MPLSHTPVRPSPWHERMTYQHIFIEFFPASSSKTLVINKTQAASPRGCWQLALTTTAATACATSLLLHGINILWLHNDGRWAVSGLRWKRLTANSYFVIACHHSKKVTLGIKFPITLTWLCTFFSAAGSWETQGKRRAQWLEHLGLNL